MINKIKTVIKNNKNIVGLLCLFVVIQPLIDILPLYEDPKYSLIGFTIPTIIRCIFIFILCLSIVTKIDKKKRKYFIIYFTLLIIYSIIHHYITSSNSMILPDNYIYSLSQELFYVIRMIFPFIIIKVTELNNISYKKFINTLLVSSIIISVIIIIGNTFCISYASYGKGKTVINWIQWFTSNLNNYEFKELTSKGWFYMANQVSGIMVLLLPFNVYELIVNKNKISFTSTLLLILSMIMLGTRTAAFGWVLIVIATIIVYWYFKMILKDERLANKRIYPVFIIGLIGLLFLVFSPIARRTYEYHVGSITKFGPRPSLTENVDLEKVYKYINDTYPVLLIHDTYIIDVYNYKYDPQFWYDTFDIILKNGNAIDNRENQLLIANQIMKHNNYDIKYSLFGYSFSRMRNAGLYPEHDFIVQIFTMGWLGLLLLIGPYILIFVYAAIKVLKNLKQNKDMLDVMFLMSLSMIIIVSLLTSHIFDELFVTIYLGFICGYFLNKIGGNSYEKGKSKCNCSGI